MKQLLAERSPIRMAIESLADDLLYSVLALLCAVPLITAGAAFTALFDMIFHCETNRGIGIKEYFSRFAFHFRKATVSWAGMVFLGGILFLVIRYNATHAGPFRIMIWGILFFLIWLWILLAFYMPPLLTAEREGSVPELWKTALFTGIALLPRSVLMMLIASLPGLVYLWLPDVFWYISFFWVFFWPAAAARLIFKLIRPCFPEFNTAEEES